MIESEAYNKILFRESWIANVVQDPETGKFTDCNPAAAKLYGYSDCSEVIGKTPSDDMSAPFQYDGTDSAAAALENTKIALNKGHHTFLWKHQRPDGTIWDGEVALFAFTYKEKKMLQFILQDITERKKAQDALKKSNFFLSRSQKVGKIGSFVLNIPEDDPEAHTWESTPELDRIFGIDATYPRTGESWLALIVQRDEVAEYFKQQVFDTKTNFKKEYQIVRPSDGEVRWIFGRGELEFDDQGNCIRMIGTVQDITERKRSEELLRQSQTQLSEAMKMAFASHWEYDVASDTFTFSDHFYQIFRTTVQEVGGYHMSSAEYIRRFCHPDDAHIVEREVQMVIETSDPKYSPLMEYRILYADGEVGSVLVRFFIVKDDQGRTMRCFGVIQDITERKKAEEFRRFTQFVMDNTIDQAFWTTADGHFVYVNEAACRALGYSREELMRLSVFDIVPVFSPETFAEHWRELQVNRNASFETFHRSKNGRVYSVEVRSNYLIFDGKEYICAFVTDITERKRMQSEREGLIKKLQKALAEITELRGILPICSNCKKIRDDKGYWTQIESYIHEHSGAEFSHGICPDCMKKLYPEYADES